MSKKQVTTKRFHLGHILSITTGVLLPAPGVKYPIDTVHDILRFMNGGESLYEVQLGYVSDAAKPYLLEQFPSLAKITSDDILPDWKANFQKLVEKYGEWFDVKPLSAKVEVAHPVTIISEKMN